MGEWIHTWGPYILFRPLLSLKGEAVSHTATQMNLEDMLLGEISQPQKDNSHKEVTLTETEGACGCQELGCRGKWGAVI